MELDPEIEAVVVGYSNAYDFANLAIVSLAL